MEFEFGEKNVGIGESNLMSGWTCIIIFIANMSTTIFCPMYMWYERLF
jgi:hypothetical protein